MNLDFIDKIQGLYLGLGNLPQLLQAVHAFLQFLAGFGSQSMRQSLPVCKKIAVVIDYASLQALSFALAGAGSSTTATGMNGADDGRADWRIRSFKLNRCVSFTPYRAQSPAAKT